MTGKPESCSACGRYTERGKQQLAEQSKVRPIYGTDFSKPLSELVAGIRSDISNARGKLSDISFAYRGWGEHLECSEGGLTCVLVALHHTMELMKEAEANAAQLTAAEQTKKGIGS